MESIVNQPTYLPSLLFPLSLYALAPSLRHCLLLSLVLLVIVFPPFIPSFLLLLPHRPPLPNPHTYLPFLIITPA